MANAVKPNSSWVIPLVLGIGVGGVAGWLLTRTNGLPQSNQQTTKPKIESGPSPVTASGKLEPISGLIGIYGPTGDRILQMNLKQGQVIQKNQPLFTLASATDRKLEVEIAESQLADAKQQRDLIERAANSRIQAIEVELAQANTLFKFDRKAQETKMNSLRDQLKRLEAKLAKFKELSSPPTLEIQELESNEATLRAEIEAGQALLDKLLVGYDESQKVAEKRKIAALADRDEATARVPVGAAQKRLEAAKYALEQCTIKSPIDGKVIKINQGEGSTMSTVQPVLQIADISKIVVVAEVYQSFILPLENAMKSGPVPVTIKSLALGERELTGKLMDASAITRMISRNSLFSPNPREDADRRIFEVRVELDESANPIAGGFLGLQVDVKFELPAKPNP